MLLLAKNGITTSERPIYWFADIADISTDVYVLQYVLILKQFFKTKKFLELVI